MPPFGERVANSACHLFILWLLNCIRLSGAWYGSDCISSWVHLFTFLYFFFFSLSLLPATSLLWSFCQFEGKRRTMCLEMTNEVFTGRWSVRFSSSGFRRKTGKSANCSFHNFSNRKLSVFCLVTIRFTQPVSVPSLPNIQWKTRKRRGYVIGYSINKIEFSKGWFVQTMLVRKPY